MILEILLLLTPIVAYLCYKIKQKQSTHWQNQGVRYPPGRFPMGNRPDFCNEVLLARKNVTDVAREQYRLMKGERFYGTINLVEPTVMVIDPELIKQILVKDFNHFTDRMGHSAQAFFAGPTRVEEIWRKQLLTSTGETWKNIRSTFTPIFTSGKMKGMVHLIHEVNDRLMRSFDEEASKGNEFDVKDKYGRFSMDTIASCAFGMDAQSFADSNSVFVRNARSIFRREFIDVVKIVVAFIPGGLLLLRLLRIPVIKPKETTFFDQVIQNTLRERQKSNVRRNDLIDLMLDAMKDDGAKDDAEVVEDADARLTHKANKKDLDEISIIATAMIIFIAGYDTTSQMLAYATYELAKNQDIQKRLQDEIDDTLDGSDSKHPDYSQIQRMEYLDMVLHETLRKYPVLAILERACTEDYVVPGTNVRVAKGEELHINAAGVHSDPEFYPEPEKFNPEHFSKESKERRHPYTFLGFGQGPRNCIGMRFALLEAKIALISLLRKYNVVRGEKTVEVTHLDPASAVGACKEGLFVKLVARD